MNIVAELEVATERGNRRCRVLLAPRMTCRELIHKIEVIRILII